MAEIVDTPSMYSLIGWQCRIEDVGGGVGQNVGIWKGVPQIGNTEECGYDIGLTKLVMGSEYGGGMRLGFEVLGAGVVEGLEKN